MVHTLLYGLGDTWVDITFTAIRDGILYIPKGDLPRAQIFGDPLVGVVKVVKWTDPSGRETVYDADTEVLCRVHTDGSTAPTTWSYVKGSSLPPEIKLNILHGRLRIHFGSMMDEYTEQLMAMAFVRPDAKVLEIGGNIGRNSCVIASILDDASQLVVLETHPDHARELAFNRDTNQLGFHVEASALSRRQLIQYGWETRPWEPMFVGEKPPRPWVLVPTLSWGDLTKKYDMAFDTLVADCEGALYYILLDEPDMLAGIHTVLIENDFKQMAHKKFVDEQFAKHGLQRRYVAPGPNGVKSWCACPDVFYEVWSRA